MSAVGRVFVLNRTIKSTVLAGSNSSQGGSKPRRPRIGDSPDYTANSGSSSGKGTNVSYYDPATSADDAWATDSDYGYAARPRGGPRRAGPQ